jgi:hypothetical protein
MERTLAIQEKSDADLKEMKVEMKANLKWNREVKAIQEKTECNQVELMVIKKGSLEKSWGHGGNKSGKKRNAMD